MFLNKLKWKQNKIKILLISNPKLTTQSQKLTSILKTVTILHITRKVILRNTSLGMKISLSWCSSKLTWILRLIEISLVSSKYMHLKIRWSMRVIWGFKTKPAIKVMEVRRIRWGNSLINNQLWTERMRLLSCKLKTLIKLASRSMCSTTTQSTKYLKTRT